ncbi:MAG: hypothetical protein HRT35_27395, partial [Algicola sp.]|nr:hypothetical protein [Algicola sp.]
MSLIAFLQQLKEKQIFISQKDGRLAVKGNKKAITGEIKSRLSASKLAIVQLYADLGLQSNEQLAPVTESQERLWFITEMGGNDAVFNIPLAGRLNGKLDIKAMEATFNTILQRHDSLRTRFIVDGNKPHQVVQSHRDVKLLVTDLSHIEGEALLQEQVRELVHQEAIKPFDLTQDLLLRAQLLRLNETEFVLLYTLHHIAADGWSVGVLTNEINALYNAYAQQLPNPLLELEIQFSDYAHWERQRAGQGSFDAQVYYWQHQLAGLPQVHSLPLDKPRTSVQTYQGSTVVNHIDRSIVEDFSQLCQTRGTTLFMGLHASFSLLLSVYSGEKDIVVGTSIANREHPGVGSLIGFFL